MEETHKEPLRMLIRLINPIGDDIIETILKSDKEFNFVSDVKESTVFLLAAIYRFDLAYPRLKQLGVINTNLRELGGIMAGDLELYREAVKYFSNIVARTEEGMLMHSYAAYQVGIEDFDKHHLVLDPIVDFNGVANDYLGIIKLNKGEDPRDYFRKALRINEVDEVANFGLLKYDYLNGRLTNGRISQFYYESGTNLEPKVLQKLLKDERMEMPKPNIRENLVNLLCELV